MTGIIDYDAGNIGSVEKALLTLGEEVVITKDRDTLMEAERVILPGVGAFADAMEKLHARGLVEVIDEIVKKGIPFLGICLGMQLLFERSDEGEGVKGLDLLQGEIVRIPEAPGLKIPHIGWNSLKFPNRGRLYEHISEDAYVYFVHSYYLKAADPSIVTAVTEYGTQLQVSVEKDNIFGCQFHPEKSSDVGLQILKNFLSIRKE